jgi:2-polyprenyl-3-methyl-5-hydroxy-6-metoxy-1,4-benzoquinol methylase
MAIETREELETYRREHRQADCYESPIPGVSLQHKQRVSAVLKGLDASVSAADQAHPISLLEVGCGEGYLLERIHQTFPAWHLIGVDLSSFAVECARNRVPSASIEVCEDNAFPVPPTGVDLVVCSEVIEHVQDDKALLTSICRVLRPSGSLILTTPNLLTTRNRLRARLGREIGPDIPEHVREYNLPQLKELLTETGFHIHDLFTVGFCLPRMDLIYRSRLLSRLTFALAHVFPASGRVIICRAGVTHECP